MWCGETGNRAPCEHTCSGSSLHLSYLVHLLGIILLLALSLDNIYYSGQNQPKSRMQPASEPLAVQNTCSSVCQPAAWLSVLTQPSELQCWTLGVTEPQEGQQGTHCIWGICTGRSEDSTRSCRAQCSLLQGCEHPAQVLPVPGTPSAAGAVRMLVSSLPAAGTSVPMPRAPAGALPSSIEPSHARGLAAGSRESPP